MQSEEDHTSISNKVDTLISNIFKGEYLVSHSKDYNTKVITWLNHDIVLTIIYSTGFMALQSKKVDVTYEIITEDWKDIAMEIINAINNIKIRFGLSLLL